MTNKIFTIFAFALEATALVAQGIPNDMLFVHGKTDVVIVTDTTQPSLNFAANELHDALLKVSGAEFTIVTNGVKPSITIAIDTSLAEGEVSIEYKDSVLHLCGGTPLAALHSVYYFLQRNLGVRWIAPGQDGELMPKQDSFRLTETLNTRHSPKIKYRGFHTCGDWYRIQDIRTWMSRNFVNIHRHGVVREADPRFISMWSSHNVFLPKSYFEKHPEYFAEINGKRHASQVCLCNPDVDELIYQSFVHYIEQYPAIEILSIFPSDNMEYCQCAKCAEKGASTTWFDFYNRITDRLKEKFPNLKFSTLAYQGYRPIPKNLPRNSVFIEYATYDRCNIHCYGQDCKNNKQTYDAMIAWGATGVPMGNYGYEFDTFSGKGQPFLPFYSMIEDAVKQTVKLGQIELMTEIGLSPRNGPEIDVEAFRDRLGLYLYAQLMWDPDASKEDIIMDWCKAAYGSAADAMFEYYMTLDTHWNAMSRHLGILTTAVTTAEKFVTKELQKKVENCFDNAIKALGGKQNANLEFDKLNWTRWLNQLSADFRCVIPAIANTNDITSAQPVNKFSNTKYAWTTNGIVVFSPKLPFEIELNPGTTGESFIFSLDSGLSSLSRAWRRSSVGVDEFNVDLPWSYSGDIVTIPFKTLGLTSPGDNHWQIRIKEQNRTWPESAFAMLQFSRPGVKAYNCLYWSGSISREKGFLAKTMRDYEYSGWFAQYIDDASVFTTNKPDVYVFRNPSGENTLPIEAFSNIRTNIAEGATAVFVTYLTPPLDKYFDDPTFTISVRGIGKIILSERHAKPAHQGKWLEYPYAFERQLCRTISPAYYLTPKVPESWTVLATELYSGEEGAPDVPTIIVRKYGKGLVIVVAADPRFSLQELISNIIANKCEI